MDNVHRLYWFSKVRMKNIYAENIVNRLPVLFGGCFLLSYLLQCIDLHVKMELNIICHSMNIMEGYA
jgi:hypothetical protein